MKIVDQATGKEIPRPEGEPEEEHSPRAPAPPRPRTTAQATAGGEVCSAHADHGPNRHIEGRVAALFLFLWADRNNT